MDNLAAVPAGSLAGSITSRRIAVALIGAIGGAAAALNGLTLLDPKNVTGMGMGAAVVVGAVLGAAVLWLIDRASQAFATQAHASSGAAGLGLIDTLSYLPAVLPVLGAIGLHIPLMLTVLAVLIARAGAIMATTSSAGRAEMFSSFGYLAFLFLISGFAALIYQIVWQRTLFTAFGVNIESITIIVSLFMFGLGIGSFVGGLLSHKFPNRAPLLFFICEAGIGLFGVFSVPLIGAVSRAMLHGSLWQIAAAVFALLCVPTMLMGATLPILVTHINRHLHSVGKSVGLLYCINTVGSAIACFLTADLLFVFLGQQASVLVAAACNLLVGLLVFRFARRIARRPPAEAATPVAGPAPGPSYLLDVERTVRRSSMTHRVFVLFFAAATGYISLSQEMVWMRVVGYMTGGQPAVFAYVLGFFLIGVAFGAFLAEKLCERYFGGSHSPVRFVALMLLISGLFYYLSIVGTAGVFDRSQPIGLAATSGVVAIVSFLLGGVFPVLCHYGTQSGRSVGLAVSRLYLANIVGCTVGPLLTGFVFMEHFSTAQIVLGLSVATLALGAVAWLFDARRGVVIPILCVAAAAGLPQIHGSLYANILEKLHHDRDRVYRPYRVLVENRHGIIATAREEHVDVIYGGGMYDGTFNTDPVTDSNWIFRCYMMAALHPGPADVLEVGMSGASWSRVMANYAPVQRLTIIEINPGYLDVIATKDAAGAPIYPQQNSVLDDPKVRAGGGIQIDDGRRWLNRHPDRKFDFILQNTTHHWRSQITNLVSREYLELCKSRLKPGGVLYMNTTFNNDIPYTAAAVFKHIVKVRNFVAASDSPFNLTADQIRDNLRKFVANGKPVFDESQPDYAKALEELATWLDTQDRIDGAPPRDLAPVFRARTSCWLITDDNMATEYKLVRWFSRGRAWGAYLASVREAWASRPK